MSCVHSLGHLEGVWVLILGQYDNIIKYGVYEVMHGLSYVNTLFDYMLRYKAVVDKLLKACICYCRYIKIC